MHLIIFRENKNFTVVNNFMYKIQFVQFIVGFPRFTNYISFGYDEELQVPPLINPIWGYKITIL